MPIFFGIFHMPNALQKIKYMPKICKICQSGNTDRDYATQSPVQRKIIGRGHDSNQ